VYAAVNRAPLRPGQAPAFVALWEALLPRVLAFPGCQSATVLVDEAAGWAASVVLYDTAARAAAVPDDPAYWAALAGLGAILDLDEATREVYAVALVDLAAPARRWWRAGA
jgi:quinol monooxygenase YgiN